MFCTRKLFTRGLMNSNRGFSTSRFLQQAKQSTGKSHWSSTFDKSMIYPGILLILFGSQLMNVMNGQKNVHELERVYLAKIHKIEEIVKRLESGEIGLDVKEEMKLVNKTFERQFQAGKMKLGKEYEIDHEEVKKSSVELEDDLNEEDFMKILGLHEDKPLKKRNLSNSLPAKKEFVITDTELIREQTDKQKKLTSFVVVPETHVIVENPGDYNDAAKDTKLSKFL